MPNVSFRRPELVKRSAAYSLIRDAITGEIAVKAKGTKYLPPAGPVKTDDDRADYSAYLTRAVYYNVTGRTLQGLIGQIFSKPPLIEVPAYLEGTVADMTGLNVNAAQQAKSTVGDVTSLGRAGLLADFPSIPQGREVTAEDLLSGIVKPTITRYTPEQIINWRYSMDGSTKKLLFVILEEEREFYQPGDFTFTLKKQWRVCRLDESGLYVQEVYLDNNSSPQTTYYPTDYTGTRLSEIPFEFIGAEDNDPDLDEAPMYALASINIAHYRNSADFEDSCFRVGQPTTAMVGLTTAWVTDVFHNEPIRLGSKFIIPLPAGSSLEFKQADPNNLVLAAMESKERQMVALGAKLVEQRKVQRTATEANQEENAEASVLQTVADNASVAYAQAFAHCAKFISGDDPKITYKLNTAFDVAIIDAATRLETIKEWQQGAITFEEMRSVLRRCGVATEPDDEAKAKILEEEKARAAMFDTDPASVVDPESLTVPAAGGGSTGATGA